MSELKWNWAYYPYLDSPEKQKESALKAGYIKVVNKDEADKVIAEKDKEIARLEAMRKVHVEAIASMEDRLHQDEKKIRRLCRALWIAREWRAWCEAQFWFIINGDEPRDVYHLSVTKRIHRTPTEWIAYWQKVEQKCKAKCWRTK